MKSLNNFLTNKSLRPKSFRYSIYNSKHTSGYTVQPESKMELQQLIEDAIMKAKENGDDECDLNFIDTSLITDMARLFLYVRGHEDMNFDVSDWDVSNVITMSSMFEDCKKFDCDLSRWDVSNVENMNSMFFGCKHFHGQGLNYWDMSNVEDISHMFRNCGMLCQYLKMDLSKWDVSNIKFMVHTFNNCQYFNSDLSNWDVSNVINMSYTFNNCRNFTGKGLENWDVSNVKDMDDTFHGCIKIKNLPEWYK